MSRKPHLVLDGRHVALGAPVHLGGQPDVRGRQEGGSLSLASRVESIAEQQFAEFGIGQVAVLVHAQPIGVPAQVSLEVVFVDVAHVGFEHDTPVKRGIRRC